MSVSIKVENLSFCYHSQDAILQDISFEVNQGEFLAIAGPNGAGKTTLLNLLCGLIRPKSGSIKINEALIESYSIKKLAQKVAVVRQEFVPVFDFTVTEVVSMARTPYLPVFGFESKADKKIVADALAMTDTTRFDSRPLGELSGGERQRVFIARALAQNTPVLLLDEPTSFLDLKHQVGIYDLLKTVQLEKNKTIVAVTHDINLAAQYCDKAMLLGKPPLYSSSQETTPADSTYRYGCTKNVFSPEQIEKVFGVRIFAGNIGQEKFFIPMGKLAKDSSIITAKPDISQQK